MATILDRGLQRDQAQELTIAGQRRRTRWTRVALYIALVAIALFFIVPMLIVFLTSLKYRTEVYTDPGLFPANPGLENYTALLGQNSAFYRWFLNSALVSTVGTIITVVLTSLS